MLGWVLGACVIGGMTAQVAGQTDEPTYPPMTWAAQESLFSHASARDEGMDIVSWEEHLFPGPNRHWVYVTGWVTEMDEDEVVGTRFATFKYDAEFDDQGNPPPPSASAFFPAFGGPGHISLSPGEEYKSVAMAIDDSADDVKVYVVGQAPRDDTGATSDLNYCVIKYDKDLVQKEVFYYDGPVSGDDIPADVSWVGGKVVVTGTSLGNGTGKDIATLVLKDGNLTLDGDVWPSSTWGGGGIRSDPSARERCRAPALFYLQRRLGMRLNGNPILALALASIVAAEAVGQCEPVWSSMGGLDGHGPKALHTHDEDGPGPNPRALIVGNGLEDIFLFARWDGWEASSMGDPHESSLGIHSFTSIPAGVGMLAPGLYAGGELKMAGGVPVNSLARWADGEWHDVGGGVTQPGTTFTYVFAMQLFDEDGEGPLPPALFVGGIFEHAGGVPVQSLARWDGREWSAVGDELGAPDLPTVRSMSVYDDGRGPALYVGGSFRSPGGERTWNVARWDGAEWEPVGPGLNGTVHALHVFDEDGPGPKRPALFAGGGFSSVVGGESGSMRGIGRWDGAEWTSVGDTLNVGSVFALTAWDEDGSGPAKECLYVGGTISRIIGSIPVNHLVRWDGEQWYDVGGGVTGFGAGTSVSALAAFDEDGPGPNPGGLYVGGLFYRAGEVETKHIARWGCPLPPAPACYADCDGSGDLTFFDFLCFQNLFAAGDPAADCDGSGGLDFFDFLCFQNAFAAGCP